MAFADRPYYGGGNDRGGGDWWWRIVHFFNLSFPIGRYLGINVSLHITFVLLLAFHLLSDGDPMWTLRWTALLFGSVLLHEFGHALACRRMGGTADDILLWPLGGLAFCHPPQRPWPEFVTVIWGPLVNVIIGGAAYATLFLWYGADSPVSLHPLAMYRDVPPPGVGGLVTDLFVVNYALTLFNMLLIFYPFDGGRLVQIAIWVYAGYRRSMLIATRMGMLGAIAIALYGLAVAQTMLLMIGFFGFVTCYQQLRAVQTGASLYGEEYDTAYMSPGTVRRRSGGSMLQRWKHRRNMTRLQERARKQRELEEEVDRILEKVSRGGLQSLSRKEKRTLQQATELQRQG